MNLAQKILLGVLYGLLILMVIFSIGAAKNIGEDGFNSCIQKKCEDKGEKFCQKAREIQNCCLGAGGDLGQAEGKLTCVFT